MAFLALLDAGTKKGDGGAKSQVVTTNSISGFNKTSTGGYAYGQPKTACTFMMKHLACILPTWDIRAN
ncbi:hypothetical protein GQ53DRAFT_743080 [Thozetella sp. PMI_491]|nr:hypothetical protein GQ53DRAFT_743080 [Thozetella sp. PMI_491]